MHRLALPPRWTLAVSLLGLAACLTRPVDDNQTGGSSTGATGDGTTMIPPQPTPPLPSMTAADDSTSGITATEGDATDTSTGEVGLGEGEPCELEDYGPPCASGLKCMPYSTDGTTFYNDAACFPIDPTPVELYEPCVWHEFPWSGYDNCGDHAFCEDFDGDGVGTCKGICLFSPEDEISCEDDDAVGNWGCQSCFCTCEISCDPLDPRACPPMQGCYPRMHPAFGCLDDFSEDMGAYGDPCESISGCDAGRLCSIDDDVPGCPDGSLGCCTEYCDLTQPNTCPDMALGQECIEFFGNIPPGLEHVGYCGIR